jgi:hypothetical protein
MNFQESIAAAWAKIQGMLNGFIVLLPNIVLAAIALDKGKDGLLGRKKFQNRSE